MELKDKLLKPYTNFQRADFVVKNNHRLGYEIKETDEGLEAWGNTTEEQSQQEYDDLCKNVRSERDTRINVIEWRVDRYRDQKEAGDATSDSEEQFKLILKYIQELRDVPSQEGFPSNVVWPELPTDL